jgi:hypothetical protein
MVQVPLCIVLDFYPNGNLFDFLQSKAEIDLPMKIKILKGKKNSFSFDFKGL